MSKIKAAPLSHEDSGRIFFFFKGVKPIINMVSAAMAVAMVLFSTTATAGDYDTNAWGGKFRYGAYSTLISSAVLGTEFRGLIHLLNDPHANLNEIEEGITAFRKRYKKLSDHEIAHIIDEARADQTNSIFEEERSVVSSIHQNKAFINAMTSHPDLAPVDHLVHSNAFVSGNFQFSAHRGLYNDAYGIPQNSLAAIINAYVAGIRNVEFDVLDTADHTSILIHDLVSNRLNGDFSSPPLFVEDHPYETVRDLDVDVLIPFNHRELNHNVETTGVKMITTARVLQVVHALMPEMTLYIDARNDAPLGIIRLLHDHPEYRDNVVLKIYPFSLSGGLSDLIKEYANRYFDNNLEAAATEIYQVKPHVLLAIGHAEMEANEDTNLMGAVSFDWQTFLRERRNLPFSRTAAATYMHFNGQPVFSDQELIEVEYRTYLLFKWAMGLTGITDPLVFQMTALPSLTEIISNRDVAEYDRMNAVPAQKYRISAAVHDNFLALLNLVKSGQLVVKVSSTLFHDDSNLLYNIQHTKFGLSDRYPDFAIARRIPGSNDVVDPNGMVNFNYSMLGMPYLNQGYQAEKVRSAVAIYNRAKEIAKLTNTPVVYATTDLPTDLRLTFMGLLGRDGLPADVEYRAGGIIKERYSLDPTTFKLPDRTLSLNQKLLEEHGNKFSEDAKKIQSEYKSIKDKERIRDDIRLTYEHHFPLTNEMAWERLRIHDVVTSIDKEAYDGLTEALDHEIADLNASILKDRQEFKETYNSGFVKERNIITYQ